MAVSTSVSAAVAQAVSFLTRSLVLSYPAATVSKLQLILEVNLTAHYAPTWNPESPRNGSGRRALTLSRDCLPPRVIYNACLASGVQWFDWANLIGIPEFDLFVDPACVRLRVCNEFFNVWAHDLPTSSAPFPTKTKAQQLLEHDSDAGIFDLIADEMNAPTWITPSVDKFPFHRSSSPLSTASGHSRCSSRSSSSGFSMSSGDSETSASSVASSFASTVSQHEEIKTARVFVNTSKNQVTPYDGGKTTVLTGGVMLGGGPVASQPRSTKAPSGSWRTVTL